MSSYKDCSASPSFISCSCEACRKQKPKEVPKSRIRTAFGRALQDLRKQHGWSIDDLCERVHYEPIGIELYERGMQNPHLGVLMVLAQAFGISPVEFMIRITHHLPAPSL